MSFSKLVGHTKVFQKEVIYMSYIVLKLTKLKNNETTNNYMTTKVIEL